MYTAKNNKWERIMMAITFAEAGEQETAVEMLSHRTGTKPRPETKTRIESEKRPELRV